MSMSDAALLSVRDLTIGFATPAGQLQAVDGVSFDLQPSQILAVVGESGSGKSAMALGLLGLNRGRGADHQGQVLYGGVNLLSLSERQMRGVRGAELSMVFQDALSALNPLQPIGWQIAEMIRLHKPATKREADDEAVRLLDEVGIPQARVRARAYPHQFSGGMRQRAMIAMALACDPKVLIADEPTTALDVTIQAQILDLLCRLRDERGAAIVLITHDLGIVAETAQQVAVMYAGRIVEQASCAALFDDPQHPYTWGLLGSVPRIDRPPVGRLAAIPGLPPDLVDRPKGCAFAARCAQRFERCATDPALDRLGTDANHRAACWLDPAKRAKRRAATLPDFAVSAPA